MQHLLRFCSVKVILFIISATIFLSSISHAQSLSGAYTIGGNNPDFATIRAAVTALDTNGVSASVTFNIRPGVYEENAGADRVLYISQQINGASGTNQVTFQPDPAGGATVDDVVLRRIVGSYGERGWIAEIRSDGIVLKELTIEYADTSTAGYHPNTTFAPVHIQKGSGSSRISNVTVTGCKILGKSAVQRSPQGISLLDEVDQITITDNLIDRSKDGITLSGSSWRKNITISDNKFLRLLTHTSAVGSWKGYGIQIKNGQGNIVIRNNIIDYRDGGYGVAAIDIANGFGHTIEANQILNGQNNRWNERAFYGIKLTGNSGQATIINNMIASRSPGDGIHLDAPDCRVINNTVIQSTTGVVRLENAQVFRLRKTGNMVVNNIFIQLVTGDIDGGVVQIDDTTGNIIDYNCLYKSQNDGLFVKANGITYDSFINWQASGNGLNSIEKYPEFKDILSDLHLDGCSIYDPDLQEALPDTAVQFDLDEETRDVLAPFFGADEAEGTLPEIFTRRTITPTQDEALHFTSGDLDGDGDIDIAVVNGTNGSNDVSIFLNDGFADFSVPIHIPFGSQPEVIAAADLDFDNAVDLFATSGGKLAVRYGSPGANFSPEIDLPYQTDVTGFLVIDLDNDLDLDIFQTHAGVVGVNDGEVTQLINLGARNLTYANLGSFDAGQYPSAAASGFINDDTFVDVAVVDFINGTVSVLLNLGADDNLIWLGFRSAGEYPVSTGSSPLHANLAIGDIDGDDHGDILVGEWGVSNDGLALLRNKGDDTFFPKENFYIDDKRYSETFALLDYEGDSDLDLIVATQRQDLIFFRNDGAGNFEQFLLCQNSKLGGEPLTLLVDQFNKEVLPDVAVLTISDDIAVMLNLNYTDDVTGVTLPASTIPQIFTLEQNYPNPFNPSTTIQFAVPSQSKVTIKLFDLLGRQLTTLIDGEYPPGAHKVVFEAEGLPSGIYFYRIAATTSARKAKAFVQTKKLILLK